MNGNDVKVKNNGSMLRLHSDKRFEERSVSTEMSLHNLLLNNVSTPESFIYFSRFYCVCLVVVFRESTRGLLYLLICEPSLIEMRLDIGIFIIGTLILIVLVCRQVLSMIRTSQSNHLVVKHAFLLLFIVLWEFRSQYA